jgi:3-hydroxymyristoyl/3-hydroxydecanoyl-(acyl carrier protein) dehydratase
LRPVRPFDRISAESKIAKNGRAICPVLAGQERVDHGVAYEVDVPVGDAFMGQILHPALLCDEEQV